MTKTTTEIVWAKTHKLNGIWTMMAVDEPRRMTRTMAWVVAGLYILCFGMVAGLLLWQRWWFFSLATAALMLNELEKLRAVGFAGKRLVWSDRQLFDLDHPIVFSLEGEWTIFKPNRYYRLLRRHRHSFYVDDGIDIPDADPLPSMLWGPWVLILRGDYIYFCKAAP